MSVSIDGKAERRGPNNARFTSDDNWLDLIRWNEEDHDFLKLVSNLPKATKVTSWEMEGGKLTVHLETPGQGSSKSVLDMARGCCLVSDEWYTPEGDLYMQKTCELAEVAVGVWLPTVVETKSFDPETGKVKLRQRHALVLPECSFNEEAVVPGGVFEIPLFPEGK